MPAKYGDWFPPQNVRKADKSLVSAAAFIHDTHIVRVMALHLGPTYNATAARLGQLEQQLIESFNAAWLKGNSSSASYASGIQTELALPLWLGIVPDNARAAVTEALVKDVVDTHDVHVSTGIIGTRALFEALSMNGRTDVALQVLNSIEPAIRLY
jgi:alpha-L-rhamnosidase